MGFVNDWLKMKQQSFELSRIFFNTNFYLSQGFLQKFTTDRQKL